jgi:hypothetical protein
MLTVGPQWHFSPYRGFRLHDSEFHKHLVTGIPDISMTQMPIDDFLSRLSSMALIAVARPSLMDGLG